MGGGSRSSRIFFFFFVAPRNRKKSSQTLAITTKVCHSNPTSRCIAVWREVSCLAASLVYPCRGVVIHRVTGSGGGRTHLDREMVCLIERGRAPQNGQPPLILASWHGHATVVEKLLAAGADTDAKTEVRRAGDQGCRKGRVEGQHATCGGICVFWFLLVSAAAYAIGLGFFVWSRGAFGW